MLAFARLSDSRDVAIIKQTKRINNTAGIWERGRWLWRASSIPPTPAHFSRHFLLHCCILLKLKFSTTATLGTEETGRCKEVSVVERWPLYIAEVRLYIEAWRNRLQWKPATGDCFSFPSHCIDATRCIYIFPCFWKSTPGFKIWLNFLKCDCFGERLSILYPF